jgi:pyruvate formate lyase activating enzyme
VAVTAGYISALARPDFFRWMDAANVDLKSFNPTFYRQVCGGHVERVLETLVWLKRESSVWIEVTTLLIPGLNDSESEIRQLSAWLLENLGPDVPLHLSAFHPDFRMLDRGATSPEVLFRAWQCARAAGLRFVYTGNIRAVESQSTRCAACGRLLIERKGYELGAWDLDGNGRCPGCRTKLAGVFGSGTSLGVSGESEIEANG